MVPGRARFLRGLDEVECGISVFYQYLLYGLLIVVTGLAVYLHAFLLVTPSTDRWTYFLAGSIGCSWSGLLGR
jgi:hypothetical protein